MQRLHLQKPTHQTTFVSLECKKYLKRMKALKRPIIKINHIPNIICLQLFVIHIRNTHVHCLPATVDYAHVNHLSYGGMGIYFQLNLATT